MLIFRRLLFYSCLFNYIFLYSLYKFFLCYIYILRFIGFIENLKSIFLRVGVC